MREERYNKLRDVTEGSFEQTQDPDKLIGIIKDNYLAHKAWDRDDISDKMMTTMIVSIKCYEQKVLKSQDKNNERKI